MHALCDRVFFLVYMYRINFIFKLNGIKSIPSLFVSMSIFLVVQNADLDVESVEPHPPPAYDVPKARTAMKECEVGLAFVRDKEIGEDDWEDKVNKSGTSLTYGCWFVLAFLVAQDIVGVIHDMFNVH